ncbi:hypothetical protein N7471_009725 [Penicillium samsonianum]|uniref:uncharacterized protein n=1 Tax=Penicillium samsonianum TaxID=1882272 RepID=UPI0025495AC6|nr:uncharacterized protein N7471_009725 [Penicillium samsonianum]KAJ6128508.1 hypothetical protein N7471_009725 [Penicillium samsonianum]
MHFFLPFMLSLVWLANATYIPPLTKANAANIATRDVDGYRSVAYFVNWDIPAEKLTHILYAFANVQASGEVILSDPWSDTNKHYSTDSWADTGNNVYGCIKELFLLKKKNRQLKVLLSIGGWTYSSNLRLAFKTEEGRQKFADSSVELLKNLGFDGINVDFEYPGNYIEADQFVDTLRRLREALDSYSSANVGGYHFLLTTASPVGPANYLKEHLARMDQYLDFWNLMAYDYAGNWDNVASHDANLHASNSNPASTPFNTDQAIEYYTSHGTGCTVTNLDHEAASYCYNSESRLLISYDTPEIARKKGEYIKSRELGGGMWWELSGDKQGGDSLITTVVNTLGGTGALDKSENQLNYPISKYDNLKACF